MPPLVQRRATRTEKRWAGYVEDASPGIRGLVVRAFKQWNNVIREHLRAETALRLTVGDDAQGIPVRIVDGLPKALEEVVEGFEGFEWLLLNRSLVEAAVHGARFLESNHERARSLSPDGSLPAQGDELLHTRRTAEFLLSKLDEMEASKKIGGIQEDVLGAYFFRIPEIRLYWLAIGIVALTINVPPEALAIVVLTHELVHAYTHLGRDIDSERWDTRAFAATSMEIVEGLAQFYTGVVSQKLETRIPAARTAYMALLKIQQGPYTVHTRWVPEGEAGGEIVRVSMIECRSRHIVDTAEFEKVLERQREQVKGRRSPAAC